MSRLNVWLIRHGQSSANAQGIHHVSEEIVLSELGIQQARAAAQEVIQQPDLIIVSPLQRAQDSALPIQQRWPAAPTEIWPIQELSYLVLAKFYQATPTERRAMIDIFWERCDPFFCEGEGAESFADFVRRVEIFYQNLVKLNGFIVVVGHGQFFKAFLKGLNDGFALTSEWMCQFREQEVAQPIRNSEIYKCEFE